MVAVFLIPTYGQAQRQSVSGSVGIRTSVGVSYRAIRAYLNTPPSIAVQALAKNSIRRTEKKPAVIVVHNQQAILNELLQMKPHKNYVVR